MSVEEYNEGLKIGEKVGYTKGFAIGYSEALADLQKLMEDELWGKHKED